jgi:hypothetical protein
MVREVHQVRLNKAIVSQSQAMKMMNQRSEELKQANKKHAAAKERVRKANQKVREGQKDKKTIAKKWENEIKHR